MLYFLVIVLCFPFCAVSVDRSKFRTCADTRFCRKYRQSSNHIPQSSSVKREDSYTIPIESVTINNNEFKSKLLSLNSNNEYNLHLTSQVQGSIRIKIAENTKDEIPPRWQPTELLLPEGLQSGELTKLNFHDNSHHPLLHLPPHIINLIKDSKNEIIPLFVSSKSSASTSTSPSKKESSILLVYTNPMKFELYKNSIHIVSINERQLFHYETSLQSTRKLNEQTPEVKKEDENVDRHHGKEVVSYGEDGLAIYADGTHEEKIDIDHYHTEDENRQLSEAADEKGDNFGGHHDTQPYGPQSVGIDFSFPFAQHVYGIPEHATPLSLPTTIQGSSSTNPNYNEPYRLYNLDVFEYELDNTMTLYGQIPFMMAHGTSVDKKPVSAGIFWFNPTETFIDISDAPNEKTGSPSVYKQSHWMSETGDIDIFLFPGPNVPSIYKQYTSLIGTQQLPPLFSLGYHQCRWNYRDERDVAEVEGMFETLDYPVDVIWLDIEHTDGKRYFTWDKNVFPQPVDMQKNISAHGRKMVTIVDPHIKRDNNFEIHKEATNKGYYIKTKDGVDFDGWCWPGSSSYLDFTDPTVRQWWSERFGIDKYIGSTLDLFTWNDMNEPSVFNGPEVSMPKDCKNIKGVEHRYWHNLYGLYMQSATAEGLIQRSAKVIPPTNPTVAGSTAGANSMFSLPSLTRNVNDVVPLAQQQRPFVLSRAFWAGSQRYGAIWTGDNTATWGHFKIAAPMLLSINLAGLSFSGADVGGFFGNPDGELFTRWYGAAAFTPFFRGHAHIETKRREPWVYGEPYTTILRSFAMIRYSLLPYWYTLFYSGYMTGMPVMRPMWMEFPADSRVFAMDNQWMVGDTLLVCPVTDEKVDFVNVFFPATTQLTWYDFNTYNLINLPGELVSAGGGLMRVNAPLETTPVFIRGGKILPRKMRLRRSSKLMHHDPYTLIVAPDVDQSASGTLYMDDEISLAHEVTSSYVYRKLTYTNNVLKCTKYVWSNDEIVTHSDDIIGGIKSTQISPQKETKGKIHVEYKPMNTVERIDILGQEKPAKQAKLTIYTSSTSSSSASNGNVEVNASGDVMTGSVKLLTVIYDTHRKVNTVKKPDVLMNEDWTIELLF